MGLYKCWYRCTCLFSHVLTRLNCLFQEKPPSRQMLLMSVYVCILLPVMRGDSRQVLLLPNDTRGTHFYTNARVLIPAVMFLNQAEYHQITDANVH